MLVDNIPDDIFRAAVARTFNKTALEYELFHSCRVGRLADLMTRIKRDEIDTSHWTGRYVSKNTKRKKGSLHATNEQMKFHIVKHGLMEEKCSICALPPEWQGRHLTLHLDHIDGDRSNNQLSNLRFLCPNCHQQTETWGAKRLSKLPCDEDMIAYLKQGLLYKEIGVLYGVATSTVSHRVRRMMTKRGVFLVRDLLAQEAVRNPL